MGRIVQGDTSYANLHLGCRRPGGDAGAGHGRALGAAAARETLERAMGLSEDQSVRNYLSGLLP